MSRPSDIFERLSFAGEPGAPTNPFVGYLNSLHCRDSGGENALAEAQACNPLFNLIQVRNPLVDAIGDCLHGVEPRNVILTGHAGDGKSTIALELYKDLCGLPFNQSLKQPLGRREDIAMSNGQLASIVKDLSEWGDDDRLALLGEIIKGQGPFLLVSNTGTLLNLFCEYGDKYLAKSKGETEATLLRAISSEQRYDFNFGGCHFAVFNLALLDNLSTARRILDRMLDSENWSACEGNNCHTHCPIYRNVFLMREHREPVLTRLFLAYRRMYAYGTRLTLRQLTAHLAYILTSGLECEGIFAMSQRIDKPLMSEFMFYNRFFGDNGMLKDIPAMQLKAVKEICKQGFGERPCPTWERRLWLLTRDEKLPLGIPILEDEFDKLRHSGSGESKDEDVDLSPDQAREQVRRMLYFLYIFPTADESFIRQFLNSPAILKWWSWQSEAARLSLDETGAFKQRVFHVLQEQFTGVRLPESAGSDQRLYITLNRHKQDIRQSAQVVVAQVDFGSEFSLELIGVEDEWGGVRKDLRLVGQGRLGGVKMWLTLPFLDYVLMRHGGEASETLQAAYVARLERLKAQLVNLGDKTRGDDVLLVRLRTNHTFVRQVYAVHGDRLEVANA